jgi:hypothetical protein
MIHISEKIDLQLYIFLNQTDQVFYAGSVVMRMKSRDIHDIGCDEWEDDTENELFHVTHLRDMFHNANGRHQWARRDVEGTTVDASDIVDASNNGLKDQSYSMRCSTKTLYRASSFLQCFIIVYSS